MGAILIFSFICLATVLMAQEVHQQVTQQNTANVKGGVVGCHLTEADPDADCIPGRGGADYPLYRYVPPTNFLCSTQLYPGYYADTSAGCQVFHMCHFDGRQESFVCPVGTVFNQKYLVCEWWYNVNCNEAQDLYHLNSNLYLEPRDLQPPPVVTSSPRTGSPHVAHTDPADY